MDSFINIPAELKALPQWVCWRYEQRNGKATKVPYQADGCTRASATALNTWCLYDEAVQAAERSHERPLAGVGFVFTIADPFCGIDLDGCIDEHGKVADAAQAIIDEIASYTEVSPSGRGVKIFIKAKKPPGARCRSKAIKGFKEVEVYDTGRFFATTGQHLAGTSIVINYRQDAFDALCSRLWPARQPLSESRDGTAGQRVVAIGDDDLIERAGKAKNGGLFRRLWSGDLAQYNGDHSAADQALCNLLAFWTGRDAARMDRLFRRSGLFRGKWDERRGDRTYGVMTIANAIETCQEVYGSRIKGSAMPDSEIEVKPTISGFPCTDLGNAERMAAKHADRLRYCHGMGRWFTWDGRRWREDQEGAALQCASKTARAILSEARACSDEVYRRKLASWAIASESRTRLDAMVALAKSRPAFVVHTEDLDASPWVLNVDNGTIDLRSGVIGPHDPADLITKLAPVRFEPGAQCPVFTRFLDRVFRSRMDLIDFVQRWHGHGLTGDVGEQYLLVYYGVGANGKSVFVDTITGLMGDYAGLAPPYLLTETGSQREHPTEIADLRGKRLVIASETEQGAALKLQLIKRLTGDQSLKGRFMRQDYFEFPRTHKLVLVSNNKPRVREDSEAVWRRIRLVPFDVVIPPHERDPDLLRKLREEWPGILAWMIQGGLRWQESGLGEPTAVTQATSAYRHGEDQVGRFAEDCLALAVNAEQMSRFFTPWASIWQEYETWTSRTGEPAMSARSLGDELEKRGYPTGRGMLGGVSVKGRPGIGLRSSRAEVPV